MKIYYRGEPKNGKKCIISDAYSKIIISRYFVFHKKQNIMHFPGITSLLSQSLVFISYLNLPLIPTLIFFDCNV